MNTKTISVREIIKASPAELWEKWTTRSGLNSFFGRDSKIELKIGGAFEIYFLMDNEYGLRGSEGCKILSFLPEKMLSFSWNAPPDFPEIRNSEYTTWVVIEFLETAESSTEVIIYHTGWPEDKYWQPVHKYFEDAWPRVMANLKAQFQSC